MDVDVAFLTNVCDVRAKQLASDVHTMSLASINGALHDRGFSIKCFVSVPIRLITYHAGQMKIDSKHLLTLKPRSCRTPFMLDVDRIA